MRSLLRRRRASRSWGALFVSLVWLALLAAGCEAREGAGAEARVQRVVDGDTVVLTDGRRVRLIGLDTPELPHDGEPGEPLGEAARKALQSLLARHGGRVRLEYDRRRKDPHGRTLAHLFTPDGTNLTETLLEQGLASLVVIPPNVRHVDRYREAERRARTARRGVWRLPRFQPVEAARLRRSDRGFRVVRGRVSRVGHSRKSVWLNFGQRFSARIDRGDLPWFRGVDLDGLEGRRVEVRGLVWPGRQTDLQMRLRHPALMEILD